MELIAVFDFDRTLIKRDSMVLFFLRYFNFSWKNIPDLFRLSLETIKFFLKIYSQNQYNEKFLNLIVNSSRIKDPHKIADDFSKYLLKLIFRDARKRITKLKDDEYELVLLSASPDFYLEKIKDKLGFSKLICTKTNLNNGKIIIYGENCYGKNKIKMLLDEYKKKDVNWKKSYCFTDNKSDKHLLSLFGNAFVVNNKRFKKNNSKFGLLIWE
ncbi:MAG: HAD-IB family hydrolase [Actinobacteria bacterium]|nr:HAD-IB family hydrolase [Actinomycetota bacterium]